MSTQGPTTEAGSVAVAQAAAERPPRMELVQTAPATATDPGKMSQRPFEGASVCALLTRLAPDVWLVENPTVKERLSYPLTYRNALGLLAVLGTVFCAGLTCGGRDPRLSRVLTAAELEPTE